MSLEAKRTPMKNHTNPDYIVTCNVKDFADATIPVYTPEEFLSKQSD